MRILVVEDDPFIAMDMQDVLSELGHDEINLAHDLSSARTLLGSAHPEFAILDVNLGGELVFPLAAELLSRGIPFIFATGEPPSSFPPEWQEHAILAKPVDRTALGAAIRRLKPAGCDLPVAAAVLDANKAAVPSPIDLQGHISRQKSDHRRTFDGVPDSHPSKAGRRAPDPRFGALTRFLESLRLGMSFVSRRQAWKEE